MKISLFSVLFLLFLSVLLIPEISFSQKKDSLTVKKDTVKQKPKPIIKKKVAPTKVKEETFMDKVQKILGVRRSFDISDQITKPALLSLKKDNDEKTVFSIEMALAYKGFQFEKSGVTPSIQFDYSSKSKDQQEK